MLFVPPSCPLCPPTQNDRRGNKGHEGDTKDTKGKCEDLKPHTYDHIPDSELLMRFSTSQDNKWLGVLLERYTLLLFGVCMKYLKNEEEARDSVQQVFLKAITELQKYKVEYFKSWIYMVAKNHCLMKLRDRQGKIPTELEDNHPAEETDRNQLVETDKNLERMAEALEELNKEQKQCITLFYLEKKSYQQVAGETGFSLMQVKSYIQNGKRNLKIIMERKATDR